MGLGFFVVVELEVLDLVSAQVLKFFAELALDHGPIGEDGVDDLLIKGVGSVEDGDRPSFKLAELLLVELEVISIQFDRVKFLNGTVLVKFVLEVRLVNRVQHLGREYCCGYSCLRVDD